MNRNPVTAFKKGHKYYPVKPENIEKSRLSHSLGIKKYWDKDTAKPVRYWKGKKMSEEAKKKMSLAKKGKPRKWKFSEKSLEKIRNSKLGNKNPMYGKTSPNRGKKCSVEVRKKLSKQSKGKHYSPATEFKKINCDKSQDEYIAENKIRQTLEYRLWREAVYKKDKYHCVMCKKHCQKKDIVAHHIKSFSQYPEFRFDVNNGITLCRKCHFILHRSLKNY